MRGLTMDFSLNEQQEMLKKVARGFLEKECPESFVRTMEIDTKGYSPELWFKMADLGWLGLPFPEKHNGMGGNIVDLAVLFEEMGRAMLPSPYLSTVVLGGLTILESGSEDQRCELIPKIVKGELIISLALTEPSASWNSDGIQVSAIQDGDKFIINGTKLFVHDALVADKILCVARTAEGEMSDYGITLFLIDSNNSGISFEILETTAEDKQCEINFYNVIVPASDIIGNIHQGWQSLRRALQVGTVMLCSQMTGAGHKLLELVLDYAKTRIQFDQYIGVNQYVQEQCINIFSRVEGSRAVTYKAAYKLSECKPADMEVSIAKAWVSAAHEFACRSAHQVFAGAGYTEDSIIPLYTKRGKVAQLYLGDATHHRKKIAQQMDGWTLKIPKGEPLGLWNRVQTES